MSFPWPAGVATGIGSLPGTDIAEALPLVFDELPDLPYLPELPARGPGAEIIGRGAGFLVDFPVELYAGRWRVADRPGRDLRRTRDLLERDLDELTDRAAGWRGPLKVQAAGPWTLAAGIDLRTGGRVLRDPGAVRDLVGSLAEGLRAHVADVAARVPGAAVLLQIDEPTLPAVLAGRVPTESGLGVLRAVEQVTAADALREIIAAAGVPVIAHCCAPDVPVELFRSAAAAAVSLDLALVVDLDPLGEAIDAGLGLFAGVVPTGVAPTGVAPTGVAPGGSVPTGAVPVGANRAGATGVDEGGAPLSVQGADRVRRLWRTLGFPAARLPEQVVVTPACGLAGADPETARAVLAACRDAARRLHDEAYA